MSVAELSSSAQNYLKAIWSLQEWSSDPVTPSAIAAKVGVKLSSVSDAVRKLSDQGLLEHTPYGAVTLTATGRMSAVAMVRRHRLIETFLVEALGYRWDEVHEEADAVEHAVSDLLVDRIDAFLGHPQRDPHGDPIPSADGNVSRPEAVLLSELPTGARARVERISDEDADLLQFFAERGIGVGTVIEARSRMPFSGSLDVTIGDGGDLLSLGQVATDAVWVAPISG